MQDEAEHGTPPGGGRRDRRLHRLAGLCRLSTRSRDRARDQSAKRAASAASAALKQASRSATAASVPARRTGSVGKVRRSTTARPRGLASQFAEEMRLSTGLPNSPRSGCCGETRRPHRGSPARSRGSRRRRRRAAARPARPRPARPRAPPRRACCPVTVAICGSPGGSAAISAATRGSALGFPPSRARRGTAARADRSDRRRAPRCPGASLTHGEQGLAHRPILAHRGEGAGDRDLVAIRAAPERDPRRGQWGVGRRRLIQLRPERPPGWRISAIRSARGSPASHGPCSDVIGVGEGEQDLRRTVAFDGERRERRQGRLVVIGEPERERGLEARIVLARYVGGARHAREQKEPRRG